MSVPITVGIPVGPYPANVQWLGECLDSVRAQTYPPDEILLIDDGANLDPADYPDCRIWRSAWPMGVAAAFNQAVGAARNDLILMLGSDDKLFPDCLARAYAAYQRQPDPLVYLYCPLRYSDGRGDQNLPCNAALVTKALWRLTGGFPPESAVGACDTHLMAMMLVAGGKLGRVVSIEGPPIYWYRWHTGTDTARHNEAWQGVIPMVRGLMQRRALGEHV